ncbi:hypothetical protein [Phaeacidiphilus oryzae]|uniref:hypothetical protein n=1 Tax=Phaeacidiphilus oryzae TaxID=348818 RepID=UPI00068A9F86|nr:hypothetical protein [Phaeacidiphilus oryzae]
MRPASPAPRRHAAAPLVPCALRVLRAVPFATVCVIVSALGHGMASDCAVPATTLLLSWLGVLAAAAALAGRERGLPAIAGALAAGQLGLHLVFHFLAGTATAGSGFAGSGSAGSASARSASATGMAGMAGMAGGAGGTGGGGGSALGRLAAQLLCGPLPAGTSAAEVVRRAGIDPGAYAGGGTAHGLSAPLWFCTHSVGLGLTPAMIAGHLLAALAAGWWLRRGELALFGLLRRGAAYALPLCGVLALAAALLHGRLGLTEPAARRAPRHGEEKRRLPRGALLRHVLIRRGPPVDTGRFALAR